MHRTAAACSAVVLGLAMAAQSETSAQSPQTATSFAGILDEHPVIQYASRPTTDRVARLQHDIAEGRAVLDHQATVGYLRSMLRALGVAPESQVLVFSKTGVQRSDTGPANPRAIYFSDSVVVGYIPGARFLEMAAHDSQQGVVFYTLDQTVATAPVIARRTNCLTCHVSGSTLEVPGMITRSMFATRDGEVLPQLGSFIVDHRTPLSQRWGGFYVTGKYVAPAYAGVGHMGNVTTAIHPTSGPAGTSNEVMIRWLNSDHAARGYPSNESNIATLMVFDHQMHAMNLITRLNWESRVAASNGALDVETGPLRDLVNELTDYFLFVDEVPPPPQLTPPAGFVDRFTSMGPRDRHGRSLRQLDLEHRLLRYPCSYMIYTEAFEALPTVTKTAIYRRMWAILSGRDTSQRYAHLSALDRRAVIEILRQTKTDLHDVFIESVH